MVAAGELTVWVEEVVPEAIASDMCTVTAIPTRTQSEQEPIISVSNDITPGNIKDITGVGNTKEH